MGFGKDGKGIIIRERTTITLGTLGANTALKQDSPLAILEDFRMIKSEIFASLDGATSVEGDGQIIIGIANDELTAAEIAECLTVDGPLNRNDRVAEEQVMRAVFPLFAIPFKTLASQQGIHDNRPFEDTIRWTFSNPEGWTLFAFNMGSSALTTGGVIQLVNKYYGVWV